MSSLLTSIPSIPITGAFVDPALSLALKVKIVNNLNEPTAIGTAVGLLQSRVAIQVSNAFSLDPPMTVLDMEDEPTTFPTSEATDLLSDVGTDGMTVLFRPNAQQKHRIMNHVAQLADQEKENLSLVDRNRALADSLADELKKSSSRSSSSGSKKPTPTAAPDLDGRLKAMMGLIQGLHENLGKETGAQEELHRQLAEETGAQEELHRQLVEETGAREALRRQLMEERAERREDVEALRQVTLLITPLHLRVLLDKARQKILNHIKCDTWEDLRKDKSIYNLTEHVYTHLADTEHPPSRGAVQFLCLYNNVRRSGNSVAHTAKPEEVKAAVTTKQLESTERRWLEQLYMFTYGEPV